MAPVTDVGLDILGSIIDPETGELYVVADDTVARADAPPTRDMLASVCRFPTTDPFRLCMLRTGHVHECLPVPSSRGLAVR